MNFRNNNTGTNLYDPTRLGYSSVSRNHNFSHKSNPFPNKDNGYDDHNYG